MVVKAFYLLGGEETANTQEIDVISEIDGLEALKSAVADLFAIVEPSGT